MWNREGMLIMSTVQLTNKPPSTLIQIFQEAHFVLAGSPSLCAVPFIFWLFALHKQTLSCDELKLFPSVKDRDVSSVCQPSLMGPEMFAYLLFYMMHAYCFFPWTNSGLWNLFGILNEQCCALHTQSAHTGGASVTQCVLAVLSSTQLPAGLELSGDIFMVHMVPDLLQ